MTSVTFESTVQHQIGDEVSGCIVVINGETHAARVRVTGIESQVVEDRPAWLSADSVGGQQYPLTRTVYRGEVIRSRVTNVPGLSNALGAHITNLESGN